MNCRWFLVLINKAHLIDILLMLSFALLNLDANIVFDSPEVKQVNKHKFLMQFICFQLSRDVQEEEEEEGGGGTHYTLLLCVFVHLNVESC